MNQSELIEVVNASKEKTWEVLFTQYGDIHIHNPTMEASEYMHNATKGELNSARRVKFSDKLYLEETITEVDETNSFKVVATDHNLPFLKEMSAIYELSSIGNDGNDGNDGNEITKVKMTSFNLTSPRFMIYLMRGQLRKNLAKHLFGLKYYIETGKIVNMDNYSEIFKAYK